MFCKRTKRKAQKCKDYSGKDFSDQQIPHGDLIHANFQRGTLRRCDFSSRDLSHADFSDTDLYRADFSGSKLYTTIFRNADLTRTVFTKAQLYGIRISGADVTRSIFDRIVYEEVIATKPEDYEKASDVYITLKRAFKDHGDIETAAHYYYRQRVCQRKSMPNKFRRFFELLFLDWLIGYGEKPVRSIYWSAVIIVIFAMSYFLLPFAGLGSFVNKGSDCVKAISSFCPMLHALEISMTAFAGADLVDWSLVGLARPIISLEGLIGAIMLAIILIGFSRKIVRD